MERSEQASIAQYRILVKEATHDGLAQTYLALRLLYGHRLLGADIISTNLIRTVKTCQILLLLLQINPSLTELFVQLFWLEARCKEITACLLNKGHLCRACVS